MHSLVKLQWYSRQHNCVHTGGLLAQQLKMLDTLSLIFGTHIVEKPKSHECSLTSTHVPYICKKKKKCHLPDQCLHTKLINSGKETTSGTVVEIGVIAWLSSQYRVTFSKICTVQDRNVKD